MNTDPSHFKGADRPVERVSWDDAQAFCSKFRELSAQMVRLPTEAEWEYACRGGTTTEFYWGDVPSADKMNYHTAFTWNGSLADETSPMQTTTAAVYPSNPWGLFDFHGNIREWCEDSFDAGFYARGSSTDPVNRDGNRESRVCRGGSWNVGPSFCRAATRHKFVPGLRRDHVGFRVVFNPD